MFKTLFMQGMIISHFLQVADYETVNKMTTSNLAIVFGPNLIWSTNEVASLMHLGEINSFTMMLIEHFDKIFVK